MENSVFREVLRALEERGLMVRRERCARFLVKGGSELRKYPTDERLHEDVWRRLFGAPPLKDSSTILVAGNGQNEHGATRLFGGAFRRRMSKTERSWVANSVAHERRGGRGIAHVR